MLMVIVVADYLARHQHEIGQFRIFIRSLVLTAVPVVLVFLQPDLSTAIVLGVIWVALICASGARLRRFLILLSVGALLLLLLPFCWSTTSPPTIRPGRISSSSSTTRCSASCPSLARPRIPVRRELQRQPGVDLDRLRGLARPGIRQRHAGRSCASSRSATPTSSSRRLSEEFGFVGAALLLLVLMFIIDRCLRAAAWPATISAR